MRTNFCSLSSNLWVSKILCQYHEIYATWSSPKLRIFLQKLSNWFFSRTHFPLIFHTIIIWVNRYNRINGFNNYKRTRGRKVKNTWCCDLSFTIGEKMSTWVNWFTGVCTANNGGTTKYVFFLDRPLFLKEKRFGDYFCWLLLKNVGLFIVVFCWKIPPLNKFSKISLQSRWNFRAFHPYNAKTNASTVFRHPKLSKLSLIPDTITSKNAHILRYI